MSDKTDFISKVFLSVRSARTIADLEKIPDDCCIEPKFRMDTRAYPKIEFQIENKEILSLVESGLLDGSLNFSSTVGSKLIDPITKLLYAVAWKNGDLKKLKHIARGVIDASDDTLDQNEALVFYQFGKYLTGKRHQPIIDQHVLRAFGIYQASLNGQDPADYLSLKTITRKHKPLIQLYKEWLQSEDIAEELRKVDSYTYHIDKILFAAGKAVKKQKSFLVSEPLDLKLTTRTKRPILTQHPRCPELKEGDKYYALQEHIRRLKGAGANEFELKLKFIIEVLAIELNNTCFNSPTSFWTNKSWETLYQVRAWVSQGFEVVKRNVDASERDGEITFRTAARQ